MQINSDFSQRVVIRPEAYEFIASPLKGVSRMMLDRAGKEVVGQVYVGEPGGAPG